MTVLRMAMLTMMGAAIGLVTGVACEHLALWVAVGATVGLAWWKLTERLPA